MALENLHGAFDRFKEAEGSRGFQAFITGSIRHAAGALQEDYVRQHFMSHLTAIVGRQQLAPSTEARLQSAVSALETVYQDDMVTHENDERDAIGIGAGYRKTTTTAKLAWEEYRRAWAGMVQTLSFSNMESADAVLAIEALLTVERVDELKNNIVGVH
jgi:hypothetical protein